MSFEFLVSSFVSLFSSFYLFDFLFLWVLTCLSLDFSGLYFLGFELIGFDFWRLEFFGRRNFGDEFSVSIL